VKARKRPLFPTIMLGAVLLLLNLPILAVAINSLNAGDTVTVWTGMSLRWFGEIIGDERIRAAFWNSTVIGLLATAVSVLIAVLTTLAARLLPKRAQTAFTLTTYARLILPEVVTAVGLYLLFNYLGIGFGIATVVVGHAVFCSAYATVVIQARYAGISDRYAEAAADLGARPLRAFRRVTVPLLAPALFVSALLSFAFSFDDVLSTTFLGGPDTETLPVLMMGMIRQHVTPEVNAIAATVMVATLVVVALLVAATNIRGVAGTRDRSQS
jgi:ABC-type spermidine/putrescine transport system permease subunit II